MERVNGEIATSRRLSDERVEVCIGEVVVGYVEAAGPVFVALHGSRYDRAVEVSQSLTFDVAVAALLSHVRVVDKLTSELREPAPAAPAAAKPAAKAAPAKPAATAKPAKAAPAKPAATAHVA